MSRNKLTLDDIEPDAYIFKDDIDNEYKVVWPWQSEVIKRIKSKLIPVMIMDSNAKEK